MRSLSPFLLLALAACVSLEREPPEQLRYVLDVRRPEQSPPSSDGVLLVRQFHASTAASGRAFTYRHDDHRVEIDFHHELLVPPARAIEDATARWIEEAGLFAQVERPGSRRLSDYQLVGDLLGWWIDLREPDEPTAVVEMSFSLLRTDGLEVLWRRTIERRAPCEDRSQPAFVAGWNRAVTDLLTETEAEIHVAMAGSDTDDPDLR